MKLETLNSPESDRLLELESSIERGKKTFIEVGLALCEIRDRRLYRSEHATFEDYCRMKWNFTRQYVNQIISGAAAVKSLPPGLETIVSNQGQARALARVPSEQRSAVVKSAVTQAGGRAITAKDIQRVARGGERGPKNNAWRWWKKKTPEKRAQILFEMLCLNKPIKVNDPALFKQQVADWLERNVRQKNS